MKVYLDIGNKRVLVGHIEGETADTACFVYDSDYIKTGLRPLSISLPLSESRFSVNETKAFFEGLLPEGFTRKSVAERLGVDPDDYVSMLKILGRECIGAVSITSGTEVESVYKKLTLRDIKKLASKGVKTSADMVANAHLSLAGASGKVGLYYDSSKNKWYLPTGNAPSTHIVKQSHVRYGHIVANELLCMRTASRLGIEVPESFVIDVNLGDESVLYAVQRYDRAFPEVSVKTSGLDTPARLHQEDFAQALGIESSGKYEKDGDNYLVRMMRLLEVYSEKPMEDKLSLWKRIIFNYLSGNADGHIKNFSLLYSPDMKKVRLAPAYDLIATVAYKDLTNEMSLAIGNERRFDSVGRNNLTETARACGLGVTTAMKLADDMEGGFKRALTLSASELAAEGVEGVAEIKRSILKRGGIAFYENK